MVKYFIILLLSTLLFAQNNHLLHYDGSQYLREAVANYRSSDESGSISVWVRLEEENDVNNYSIFVSGKESDTDRYFSAGLNTEEEISIGWAMLSPPVESNRTDAYIMPINEWHHIVWSSDGTTSRIYVDGVERSTANSTAGYWFADVNQRVNITVGVLNLSVILYYWIGEIDELSIYNDDLSIGEIKKIYNGGVPNDVSWQPDLVDWWRFEEGSGTTTSNESGTRTFTFGDGSTSSTFPVWRSASSNGLGWDPGDGWLKWKKTKPWKQWMFTIFSWSLLW